MPAPRLYLNTITIKQAGCLADKFRLAKACGYAGLELWMHEVAPAALGEADRREAAERYGITGVDPDASVEATSGLAERYGLRVIGLCPPSAAAVRWHADLDGEVLASLAKTIETCAALGACYVVLPVLGEGGSAQDTADNLKRIGDPAARSGVTLGLEPVGHVNKCNRIDEALAVLHNAGLGSGAGLVVDAFHFFRAGQQLSDLAALPAERIVAVHVNDAMDLPREALFGHKHRVYPGAGIWDVRGFCRALLDASYQGHFVTEILNEEYWAQEAEAVCRAAYQASLVMVDC